MQEPQCCKFELTVMFYNKQMLPCLAYIDKLQCYKGGTHDMVSSMETRHYMPCIMQKLVFGSLNSC